MGLFSKIAATVKKVGDKVGNVIKAVAPAAITIVGKVANNIIPGAGALTQTLAASLINKSNTSAPKTLQEVAYSAVTQAPTIGQFQTANAVVKSIAGLVSVPINSNGLGQAQNINSIVTAATSGHLINASGVPQATTPARDVGSDYSSSFALPQSSAVKKIQEQAAIIFGDNPPKANNAPKNNTTEFPEWLKPVGIVFGIIVFLFLIKEFFFPSRKK